MAKVCVQLARVFATHAPYGESPQLPAPISPVIRHDFPKSGLTTTITLGNPPEEVFRAELVRRAMGLASFEWMFGDDAPADLTPEERINSLVGTESEHERLRKYGWFVSVSVARFLEIAEYPLGANRYVWFEPDTQRKLEAEIRDDCGGTLDLLSGCLASYLDPQCFQVLLVDDIAIISIAEREPFAWFELSGSAQLAFGQRWDKVNGSGLEEAIHALQSPSRDLPNWLSSASRWYLNSLRENDPWKLFLWGFFALEIMTNACFEKLLPEIVKTRILTNCSGLTIPIDQYPDPSVFQLVSDEAEVPPQEPSLARRFRVVAWHVAPKSHRKDFPMMARVAELRNQLSHGHINDPANLPTTELFLLLDRYFSIISSTFPSQY